MGVDEAVVVGAFIQCHVRLDTMLVIDIEVGLKASVVVCELHRMFQVTVRLQVWVANGPFHTVVAYGGIVYHRYS